MAGTLHFHSYLNRSMSLIKSGVSRLSKLLLTTDILINYASSDAHVFCNLFVLCTCFAILFESVIHCIHVLKYLYIHVHVYL